jgi:hypothetical protein
LDRDVRVEVKLEARNEAEARMRPMDDIPDLDFINPAMGQGPPVNPQPRTACRAARGDWGTAAVETGVESRGAGLPGARPRRDAASPECLSTPSRCASQSSSPLEPPTQDAFPRHVTVTTTFAKLQTAKPPPAPPQDDKP